MKNKNMHNKNLDQHLQLLSSYTTVTQRLLLIHTRYTMSTRHTELIHVHVVHSYKTCTTVSSFCFICFTHINTKDGRFHPRQRKTFQKVEAAFPPNQSIQSDIQWLKLLNVHEKTCNKPKACRILLKLRSSDRK